MKNNLVIFFCTVVPLMAQLPSRVREIDMPVASPLLITGIFLFFSIVVVAIVFAVIYQEKNKKKTLEKHSEHQFLRQCERFGLSANEVFSLRNYLKSIHVTSYPAVFSSVSIFEELVDKECRDIKEKWGFSAKAENATLVLQAIRKKLGYDSILSELPLYSTRNISIGQQMDISSLLDTSIKISSVTLTASSELTFSMKYASENAMFDPVAASQLVLLLTRPGDGVYTIIVDVVAVDRQQRLIQVAHTRTFERQQYRDYVRMSVDLSMQCRLLNRVKRNKNTPLGALVEECMIVDISGGGMAFVANSELQIGDRLSLSFLLGERKFVLKGDVVGVTKKERRGDIRFKHRVIFKDVSRADSDAIVRYIFSKQREQLHMTYYDPKN